MILVIYLFVDEGKMDIAKWRTHCFVISVFGEFEKVQSKPKLQLANGNDITHQQILSSKIVAKPIEIIIISP